MDVFHAILAGFAVYFYWKYNNKQFTRPQKPTGCKCAGTCSQCKKWKKWVYSQRSPCPGDEKWYYFDDWNGIWMPRPITYVSLLSLKKAQDQILEMNTNLKNALIEIQKGNELYTLEKPPAKYN